MRYIIVGIVIGGVIGVMIGTNIIAPRLDQSAKKLNTDTTHSSLERSHSEGRITKKSNLDLAGAKPEKPKIVWRMASAYSGNLPQLGSLAKRVSQNIW